MTYLVVKPVPSKKLQSKSCLSGVQSKGEQEVVPSRTGSQHRPGVPVRLGQDLPGNPACSGKKGVGED